MRNAIEFKGIEQFDYIIKTQPDELIDASKLAEDFLSMYDRLGLLYDERERQIINSDIGERTSVKSNLKDAIAKTLKEFIPRKSDPNKSEWTRKSHDRTLSDGRVIKVKASKIRKRSK